MSMSPHIDPNEFAQALVEAMKSAGHAMWVDGETHAEQHEFIAQMILERKERAARRRRIEEKVAGSLVLSGILLIISVLGVMTMDWFRKHL
jgi:hypothetical protein